MTVRNASRQGRKLRRPRRTLFGLFLFLLLGLLSGSLFHGCHIKQRVHAKSQLPHSENKPLPVHLPLKAEVQTEADTCGMHSLRSIYNAYGMDADMENLRNRLGISVPGNPFNQDSTGTVHPDLFRVLVQDGFHFKRLDPHTTDTKALLRKHLKAHAAMILIQVDQTGGMHWVCADEMRGDELIVIDSLQAEPYAETLPSYLGSHVRSILLVRPQNKESASIDIKEAHRQGTLEMIATVKRLR